jgi:polyhydroxyalkanoate synthase
MDDRTKKNGTEAPATTSFDVEAFSRNLARVIEEGGKALAAYLKPREEGKIKGALAGDLTEIIGTLGKVADYWLSDPQRAIELQSRLGAAYLELWGHAAKRLTGEASSPVAEPPPRDKRFTDPEWSSNQFFDFVKQAYLLTTLWAERMVKDA